jgi:hypothetical protein
MPGFSTPEALKYLAARLAADPDQHGGSIDLADALDCEPAALAQASTVIISSGTRCREYQGDFIRRLAQHTAGSAESRTRRCTAPASSR